MLDLADEAQHALSDRAEPDGTLTITAPETIVSYLLPSLMRTYRQRYRRVLFRFRPVPVADLRRSAAEGAVDVAFVVDRLTRSTSLHIEPLRPEPLLIVAPPSHPLARRAVVRPEDLEGETVLLKDPTCTYRALFQEAMAAAGVRDYDYLEFATVEAIKQCVIADMGVSVLAAVAVEDEIAAGRLVALPWSVPDFRLWTQMVWHSDRWVSPALRAFLALSREFLALSDTPAVTLGSGPSMDERGTPAEQLLDSCAWAGELRS
jgi:DNA-binding transcriptional LysR family regulator